MRLPVIAAALAATVVVACAPSAPVAPQPSAPPSLPGPAVFDRAAFDVFLLGRPTPAEFKARFPEILLVEPGMIVTQEHRYDHSRFFPELDAEGRIVGGAFH